MDSLAKNSKSDDFRKDQSKEEEAAVAAISCPLTGFFCQSKLIPHYLFYPSQTFMKSMKNHKPEFVSVSDEWNHRLPDPSLGFLKHGNIVEFIHSCNGLLLCRSNKTFFVCNPLTKESVVLPHPPKKLSNTVYLAFLADLTESGYLQYKVVCLFRLKHSDPCSKLWIFSSEKEEWEEFDELVLCHESMMGSKVVFNGSLFWDCLEGHILVCHLNVKKSQRCYELLEAPRAPLGRCLWIYQDKLVCYCHGFPDEFPAWSLCIDDEGDEKNKMKWKLDGCEDFETMTEDICNNHAENWSILDVAKPRILFKIMAYVPKTNSIFLWIPDSIYSYDLAERMLKHVWGFHVGKLDSPSVALPYLHSLAPIQIGKKVVKETQMLCKPNAAATV